MSETLSQLPAGTTVALGDIAPLTQGSTGPGSGITRKLTIAKILSASRMVLASDPAFAGGVQADGSTDDTASWNAALAFAQTAGAAVLAPLGVSRVSAFTVPSNVMILGRSVSPRGASATGEMTYTAGSGSTTLGSVIQASSGAGPIITLSAYAQLRDLQIVGTGAQPLVDASAGRCLLDNVTMSAGTTGIAFGASAAGGSVVDSCRIHHITGNAIDSPADTLIRGCLINSCTRGISLIANCTDNQIMNNRIEWCTLHSISLTSVDRCLISGNFCDRSGGNAILLSGASHVIVSNNFAARSGRAQSGTPGNASDAHFNLTGCNAVILSDNASSVSGDDPPAAIGYNSPFYGVYDGGSNTNCQITTNVLCYHNNAGSSTTGPINTTVTFNLASGLNVSLWEAGRTV